MSDERDRDDLTPEEVVAANAQLHDRDGGDPNGDREFLQDLAPADVEEPDEETPAGREGADTGAAEAVGIDDETVGDGSSPDDGEQNDIAGVGPRDPEE